MKISQQTRVLAASVKLHDGMCVEHESVGMGTVFLIDGVGPESVRVAAHDGRSYSAIYMDGITPRTAWKPVSLENGNA